MNGLQLKRWSTPIVYAASILPLFLISILIEQFIQRLAITTELVYGQQWQTYNSFYRFAPVVFLVVILIFWSVAFWNISKFMFMADKLQIPRPSDHFRQALFFYIYLGFYLLFSIIHPAIWRLSDSDRLALGLLASSSFWAIAINSRYLWHKRVTPKLQI